MCAVLMVILIAAGRRSVIHKAVLLLKPICGDDGLHMFYYGFDFYL